MPIQHGQWIAGKVPGAEVHLTASDGHLMLEERLPDIHAWLLSHG